LALVAVLEPDADLEPESELDDGAAAEDDEVVASDPDLEPDSVPDEELASELGVVDVELGAGGFALELLPRLSFL
jgi:hypothetical protein